MIHICACAVPTCEGRALLVSQYDRWEVYMGTSVGPPGISRKRLSKHPFCDGTAKKTTTHARRCEAEKPYYNNIIAA